MTYYRTGQGSHRHADRGCANNLRSIRTGEEQPIPADQVKNWAPCELCCTPAEVAAFHAAPVADDGYCTVTIPVRGSYNPRRMQVRGTCSGCGATEVSMTKSMNLRKHKRRN